MNLLTYLSEVRSRVDAATPGPWHSMLPDGKYYGTEVNSDDGRLSVTIWNGADNGPSIPSDREKATWGEDYELCDSHYEDMHDFNNAALIAFAPTDLRKLLQIVEIQRKALDGIEEHHLHSSSCSLSTFRADGKTCSCGIWSHTVVAVARSALAECDRIAHGECG